MKITLDIPHEMLEGCLEFKGDDESIENCLMDLLWYGVLKLRESERERLSRNGN